MSAPALVRGFAPHRPVAADASPLGRRVRDARSSSSPRGPTMPNTCGIVLVFQQPLGVLYGVCGEDRSLADLGDGGVPDGHRFKPLGNGHLDTPSTGDSRIPH
ncbi:hypothetical protein VTN02DRAFT_3879 [Thermoascus thermophilus]